MTLSKKQILEISNQPTIEKKFELLICSLEAEDDKLATKEDLKYLATKDDLNAIRIEIKQLEITMLEKLGDKLTHMNNALDEKITTITDKAMINNRWLIGTLIGIAAMLKIAEHFHF